MSDTVRAIVGRHAPPRFMELLRDDVPLSGPESGLDSIAVAEIVLECEEHFGVSLATLLESGLITITTIDDHVFRTER